MNQHKLVLTGTRVVVALLFMVAIWVAPSTVSNVCASVGTVIWLFMANVVKAEEAIITKMRGK